MARQGPRKISVAYDGDEYVEKVIIAVRAVCQFLQQVPSSISRMVEVVKIYPSPDFEGLLISVVMVKPDLPRKLQVDLWYRWSPRQVSIGKIGQEIDLNPTRGFHFWDEQTIELTEDQGDSVQVTMAMFEAVRRVLHDAARRVRKTYGGVHADLISLNDSVRRLATS